MNKEIILQNDIATLCYYPDHKIIHHTIHKFIYGEVFREVLMTGAETFERKSCQKWLSDDRKNPVLRKEDIEWGELYWKPKVLKAGWKYWAILQPEKETGKIAMKPLIEEYLKSGVTVEIFDTPETALDWLMKK